MRIVDLYKGFESEPGYFFAASDKDGVIHYYLRVWCGFVEDVFDNPCSTNDTFKGFTLLYHQDYLDENDHTLDNFYMFPDKQEFLEDILLYDVSKESEEVQLFMKSLIELTRLAIEKNFDIGIAKDEDC